MSFASFLLALGVAVTPATGGGVAGIVTDGDTGVPLIGAVVALDDLGLAAVTDDNGWYWLPGVPPGPQHLTVELLGYRSRTIHVSVPASRTLRVDLALATEPIEVEAVVARGRSPLAGIETAEAGLRPTRRRTAAAIANDPFAAEPDVFDALLGGPVARSPESVGGFHVRGGASDQVGYLLDGFPVFSPFHAGVRSSAWSPAAVAAIELRDRPELASHGLSGTVAATTVEPGDRLRASGGATTSQLRFSIDGPMTDETGFLLSARYGFPGLVLPDDEASYLRGGDHDVIAKVESRVRGGDLRVVAFDNGNRVDFASVSVDDEEEPVEPVDRNVVAWRSGTWGVGWRSASGSERRLSTRAWRSALESSVRWRGADPAARWIESEREQLGWSGSIEWSAENRSTELGLAIERDEVDYRVAAIEEGSSSYRHRDAVTSLGVLVRARRRPVEGVEVQGGMRAVLDHAGAHALPWIDLRWLATDRLTLHAGYVRARQLVQSLRNGESVVGAAFPAELPMAAEGSRGARGHTAVAGLVAKPWAGARLVLEGYARAIDGVALVAPREGGPFATGEPGHGSATIRGAALEAATSAARYGVVASYGVESVEVEASDLEYSPAYAARQRVRLGGIVHPTPTSSIRAAWTGEFGRRGTDTIGVIEWESCNLLDGGCEIAGTPEALGALGGARLPAYHRLDLSVRKHWHLQLGGRDVQLEVFASGSNLLGRTNLLGYAVDPTTGERKAIEMRPAAPMTLGLAWTF